MHYLPWDRTRRVWSIMSYTKTLQSRHSSKNVKLSGNRAPGPRQPVPLAVVVRIAIAMIGLSCKPKIHQCGEILLPPIPHSRYFRPFFPTQAGFRTATLNFGYGFFGLYQAAWRRRSKNWLELGTRQFIQTSRSGLTPSSKPWLLSTKKGSHSTPYLCWWCVLAVGVSKSSKIISLAVNYNFGLESTSSILFVVSIMSTPYIFPRTKEASHVSMMGSAVSVAVDPIQHTVTPLRLSVKPWKSLWL